MSAEEFAKLITTTIVDNTIVQQQTRDVISGTSLSYEKQDGVFDEAGVNPTVNIGKKEMREITNRKTIRRGFTENVIANIDKNLFDSEVTPQGEIKCTSKMHKEIAPSYDSLEEMNQVTKRHKEEIEKDEEI